MLAAEVKPGRARAPIREHRRCLELLVATVLHGSSMAGSANFEEIAERLNSVAF
jgi:hypothetical protein